jgi:hypothetical protein
MADEKKNPQAPAASTKSAGLKQAENPEEGTTVKLKDKIWIKGTGNSKHLPKDSLHEVNVIAGEKLISKGAAVETTAPKPKATPKKQASKSDEDDE